MHTESVQSNKVSKSFIAFAATLMSVVAITIDATLPALDVIREELHISPANQVQYVIGLVFAGLGLGQLFWGPMSDAIGRKKVIYLCLTLYLIGSLICFYSLTISTLLFGRFIQGLSVAGPYVCSLSIVRDKYSGPTMAKIMSLVTMIFIAVPAIAPSIGQGIMLFSSWRYIFVLYIGYSLLVLAWVYFGFKETLPPSQRTPFNLNNLRSGFFEVLSHRRSLIYTISISLMFSALIAFLNTCQQIFQTQFNVGNTFSLYFGGLALGLGVASMVNSKLVEKHGMRFVCLRAIWTFTLASLTFLISHLFTNIELWMFILFAAVIFFCLGFLIANLNSLALEPMGHIAGTAAAAIGFSSSLIALTIGTFIGQSYSGSLIPIAASYFLIGVSTIILITIAKN